MPRLPRLSARNLERVLFRHGFRFVRQTGSHRYYRHADGRRASVPFHGGTLKTGTTAAILKQAGIAPDLRR